MFGILRPVSFPNASLGGSPTGSTGAVGERPRLRVQATAGGQIRGVRGINPSGQRLLSGFVTGGRG